MRRVLSLTLSSIVAVAAMAYACATLSRLVTDPQDFRAFYCAGSVVRAGADPYLAAPLGACEDRLITAEGASPMAGLTVPAPLPGYVLPAFVAISALPFRTALGLFCVGILASYLIAAIVLVKTNGHPPWAIAASVWLCGLLESLVNGQIVPFALAAMCLAAFELARGNERRAGLYALGVAIEPHIGIFVMLSLFVSAPRSRWPIAAGSGAFAAIALATLGVGRCAEYLSRVLPAQTFSEIHSSEQYSFTALVHALGAPDRTALAIGDAQYVVMLLLGIVCARVVARSTKRSDLVATMPAAFALVGGPYIHLVQMIVAIPLLLALASIPRVRIGAAIALLLIAIPWRSIVVNDAPFAAGAILLTTVGIAFAFISRKPTVIALACLAMLALGAMESIVVRRQTPMHWDAALGVASRAGGALAERPWQIYENGIGAFQAPGAYLAANGPTWLALIVMTSSSLLLLRDARGRAALSFARRTQDADVRPDPAWESA